MEKFDSSFCQWIVLYTHYFNFQFSYIHAFCKPNNFKKKSSTKVKSYILSINPNKLADKYFTFDMHGHKGWRMDGTTFTRCYTLLSNAEMNLMPILFCYISHGTGQ